ncbi:MAG: RNA polymerase-binding protein DksA [Pseudomonadota bacterium]
MEKITLPEGYKPSERETYMGPLQLEYFRKKLILWKEDLLGDSRETIKHLQEDSHQEPDIYDRAVMESENSVELRTCDRYRKLIDKINSALKRIENSEYGFCEETGEKIGINRLDARPIATMTIEAQERHERYERQHSDEE